MCKEVFPSDCRLLLFFVKDAEKSNWLGFKDREDYVRTGLGLDPEVVDIALEGLQLIKPDEAIGLEDAASLGKQGRPKKGEEKPTRVGLYGQNPKYLRARLARDKPELLAKVLAGELTIRNAAKEAGFIHNVTNMERVQRIWRKATTQERRAMKQWINEQ